MSPPLFAATQSCGSKCRTVRLQPASGRGTAGEIVVRMRDLAGVPLRVSIIAGALLLAGCSSWAPSWDWVPSMGSRGAAVSLTIESDPPGADAKTSLGASCRTPCMIPVPADRAFTVSYSLNGYLPQSIPVGPRSGADGVVDVAGGTTETYGAPQQLEVSPNP